MDAVGITSHLLKDHLIKDVLFLILAKNLNSVVVKMEYHLLLELNLPDVLVITVMKLCLVVVLIIRQLPKETIMKVVLRFVSALNTVVAMTIQLKRSGLIIKDAPRILQH